MESGEPGTSVGSRPGCAARFTSFFGRQILTTPPPRRERVARLPRNRRGGSGYGCRPSWFGAAYGEIGGRHDAKRTLPYNRSNAIDCQTPWRRPPLKRKPQFPTRCISIAAYSPKGILTALKFHYSRKSTTKHTAEKRAVAEAIWRRAKTDLASINDHVAAAWATTVESAGASSIRPRQRRLGGTQQFLESHVHRCLGDLQVGQIVPELHLVLELGDLSSVSAAFLHVRPLRGHVLQLSRNAAAGNPRLVLPWTKW